MLLIDGDLFLHRGTVVAEKEVRWDEENHMLFSNEEEAWVAVEHELFKVASHWLDLTEESLKQIVICLSSPPIFRTEVDPTYKSKRGESRKPVAYTAVRERLEREYQTVKMPGLEADDVMGILSTKPGNNDTIICSFDKDMKQVPGLLWDGELKSIDREAADLFFLTQVLTGDTSDGYKGCPGVGPVKAARLLSDAACKAYEETAVGNPEANPTDVFRYQWVAIVEAFEKAGLTADDAITQARLARILRWDDWDTNKKEVKLWTPPIG